MPAPEFILILILSHSSKISYAGRTRCIISGMKCPAAKPAVKIASNQSFDLGLFFYLISEDQESSLIKKNTTNVSHFSLELYLSIRMLFHVRKIFFLMPRNSHIHTNYFHYLFSRAELKFGEIFIPLDLYTALELK